MKRGHLPTSASKRRGKPLPLSSASFAPTLLFLVRGPRFGRRRTTHGPLDGPRLLAPPPLSFNRCPHRQARAHPMGVGARTQRRLGPMGAGRAVRHVARKAPHISEPARRTGSRHNPERVDAATRTGNPDLNTHSQHTPPAAATFPTAGIFY